MSEHNWWENCHGPIWNVDDISDCVQRNYLNFIIPSITVAISILLLLSLIISRRYRLKLVKTAHKHVPYSRSDTPANEYGEYQRLSQASNCEENYEGRTITGAQLTLSNCSADGTITVLDAPRGQYIFLIAEILAIAVLICINIAALTLNAESNKVSIPLLVAIVTWMYIGILVLTRLALFNSNWISLRIWNHTTVLYLSKWLISLVIFRSAIVHPRSKNTQALIMAEFVLTSFLFGIAITSRKGNKTVALDWEDGIEPSRESLASLLSLATFGWVDKIMWKGYKKTFELSDVWNLFPRDKAATVLADYRQFKRTTALSLHLLSYFKGLVFVQCLFAVFSGLFTFAPTLLLKSILEYIEDPTTAPRNVIWLYVILLAFSDILRSLADGQALWIGRKVCIRLRAIIIGELYAKALRRKAAASNETILGSRKEKEDSEKLGLLIRIFGRSNKKCKNQSSDDTNKSPTDVTSKPADEQANMGTIINLMSVDSFNVSEITAYLHFLFAAAPAQLALAVYLLYQILGYSSIPGMVVMVILLPLNIMVARGFSRYQKQIMAATDKRIHTTNEVFQNIRIIKYFAWEQRFQNLVNDKRRVELASLRSKYVLWATAVAIWNTVPVIITFFSFLVYTVVEKKPLYPSIAFTAISLFHILQVPLDQLGDMIAHVLESKVSVDRVEEFLNEDETEKYEQLRQENFDDDGSRVIGFRKATFSWGSKEDSGQETSSAFRLMNIDVKFKIGELNIIAGPTGSGKTSLLMALLGEMTLIEGRVFLPGGYSREDIRLDPETNLTESIAYCAQQAWLVNASIKDNILFATPLDEKRYEKVINACALERDLQILDSGDETLVGEKGIALSGGQKQRISLARALYSNSKHVLLDDCLSAVDSHTAKWIFNHCIRGSLMQGRTCILVTHNLSLCAAESKYIVLLDNGKIDVHGNSDEVIASGKLGQLTSTASESIDTSSSNSRAASSPGTNENSGDGSIPGQDNINSKNSAKLDANKLKPKKDAMQEAKSEGRVKWSVISLYFKSMGPWWFWVISVTVFSVHQFGNLGANMWIRKWANEYNTEEIKIFYAQSLKSYVGSTMSTIRMAGSRVTQVQPQVNLHTTKLATNTDVNHHLTYYLGVYAAIGLSCMLVTFLRDLWLFFGALNASWNIHQRLMNSVIRAKFKFFDVTPLGQLMNRFSKDLEAIDEEIAPISIGMMSCALEILVTVFLISAITPKFLLAAILIGALYFLVGAFYLRSSRDLQRIESVQRSPLFQQFGETLSGITTIRAYGDVKRFSRNNMIKINTHSRPFIYLWATNRWLAFRMDVIGDFVAFAAGAFVILSIGKIDSGSAGLSLSYAISFTENVLWLVRLYSMNEQNMNAVERIKEYLDVEQEAKAVIPETKPPTDWPSQGSVEFVDYTTRYRVDLDPVLRGVSFKVNPGEKVGVVGRTGAGKSSLALAIFRGLEAEEGKIVVDEVDIGQIGLQDLRSSITIVPQDPTLFTGTLRTNLDPFSLFSDEDIFETLRRVQLIDDKKPSSSQITLNALDATTQRTESSENPHNLGTPDSTTSKVNKNIFFNLSSPVTDSGSNLSQGQRQLLCLARALLRKPKVLIMDEATASVDYTTDGKIQDTIRELQSTIITIAHRLQTIADYDKVLVLDQGRVVEFGHPWDLLREDSNPAVAATGTFRSMCEMSGEIESLMKTAKEAWLSGRLVDTK
ncbi:BgTH12-02369 [Blumeria graminis f. sp. triticale]|uniref:BgTH12-02369 n=1 Tax=Blumeria graminis f. sp. triticale TaxID=1689686 RepID=A0A9W4D0L0_BLUGR|nr:BgTH12-02369 [Blumeria graminis f. sp. triticale]